MLHQVNLAMSGIPTTYFRYLSISLTFKLVTVSTAKVGAKHQSINQSINSSNVNCFHNVHTSVNKIFSIFMHM